MTGRIPFGLLTLLTALACVPIQAQDPMGPASGYGAQPGGYQSSLVGPGQYSAPPGSYQMAPLPGVAGPPPRTIYEELPDDLGFTDRDTPLGRILTETFRHSWFRAEYLLWNISGPGNGVLGAQTADGVTANPTGLVPNTTGGSANIPISSGVSFNQTVNGVTGTSQSPGLSDFQISNLNGFRGTYGLPFSFGEMELSAFVLGSNSQNFTPAAVNIPGSLIQTQITAIPAVTPGSTLSADGTNDAVNGRSATFISQAILVDGQRTPFAQGNFINYDINYQAKLTTSVWGSEANFVMNGVDPNSPFQLRPSFGFRYFNFQDRLLQGGQYNQPNPSDPTVNIVVARQINSAANNNLLGPQISARAEFTYSRLLIGFEPKLMFAVNTWQSSLNTSNVLSSVDPAQNLTQHGTTFSPLVDLKGYSNIAVSKNLSAYLAYNFIWTGSVNRSANDIVYNKNSTTGNSDFFLQKNYSATYLQGLSLGFEYRY